MSTDFDFGFTLVDEADLDVSKELASATTASTSAQDKLDTLYNAITPLLNNLKANPEREYIKWPNRVDKVEAFETHIQKIYKG